MPKKIILKKGQRFGKLTVIKEVKTNKKGTHYLCECDCGNSIIANASNLKRGHKISCDCLRWSSDSVRKHGMSGSRPYMAWANMKRRCNDKTNKEYNNYGGRGITYNNKWETFQGFWEDMKEGYADNLTLDRKDTNKNYYKENCRWITLKEQANNRTNNHYVTYKGKTLTLMQLSEKYKINYELLPRRIRDGWSIEAALGPVKTGEMITYNGVTKTVSNFAIEYGLTYHQLKKRLMRGWSIERSLTQPLRKRTL